MESINPVSYTHLDVYKRQEQEQVTEETVKSIRLAAERNPLLCADKNYTKCMDAVECLSLIHISSST